jgi:trimethylamine:corrinoid methyltransferase-like protein
MQDGEKTLGQRVNEKVRRILAEYHPEPLSPEKLRQIDAIITRAEARKK